MPTRGSTISAVCPEQSLWASVVLQQLHDLCALDTGVRTSAEAWVGDWPDTDFVRCCTLAGVEPARAHAWFRGVVGLPLAERRGRFVDQHIVPPARRGDCRLCPVPGCGVALPLNNVSGVCRAHIHAVGLCACARCR